MSRLIETSVTGTIRDHDMIDRSTLRQLIRDRVTSERDAFETALASAFDETNDELSIEPNARVAAAVFDRLCSASALENDAVGVYVRTAGVRLQVHTLPVYPGEFQLNGSALSITIGDWAATIDLDDTAVMSGDMIEYVQVRFFGASVPLVIVRFTLRPAHRPKHDVGVVLETGLELSTAAMRVHTQDLRQKRLEPFKVALADPGLTHTAERAIRDARAHYQADLLLSEIQRLCRSYNELVFVCSDELLAFYSDHRAPQFKHERRPHRRAAWLPAVITDLCSCFNVTVRFIARSALDGLIATCADCGRRINTRLHEEHPVCPTCGSDNVGSLRSAASILETVAMFR